MVLALVVLLAVALLGAAEEMSLSGLAAPTGMPTSVTPDWPCPEGYFCPSRGTVNSCPYGFVCPLNTYVDPRTLHPTPLEYTCPLRKHSPRHIINFHTRFLL